MLSLVVIALLNGILIGTARTINGQLSVSTGAFKASLWNHVIGFSVLTVFLTVLAGWQWAQWTVADLPPHAFLGGVFGALFVAVSSYIFPRLGAMNAAILVIGGQMISAVMLDWVLAQQMPGGMKIAGVVLVLAGIYLTRKKS